MERSTATLLERVDDGVRDALSLADLLPGAVAEDGSAVESFLRTYPAASSALAAAAPEIAECFGREATVYLRVVTDRDEGDKRLSLRIKTPEGPRVDRDRLAVFHDRIAAKPVYRENDTHLTFGVAFV